VWGPSLRGGDEETKGPAPKAWIMEMRPGNVNNMDLDCILWDKLLEVVTKNGRRSSHKLQKTRTGPMVSLFIHPKHMICKYLGLRGQPNKITFASFLKFGLSMCSAVCWILKFMDRCTDVLATHIWNSKKVVKMLKNSISNFIFGIYVVRVHNIWLLRLSTNRFFIIYSVTVRSWRVSRIKQ